MEMKLPPSLPTLVPAGTGISAGTGRGTHAKAFEPYPKVVLAAVRSLLVPFCGFYRQKLSKSSKTDFLLRFGGPGVDLAGARRGVTSSTEREGERDLYDFPHEFPPHELPQPLPPLLPVPIAIFHIPYFLFPFP